MSADDEALAERWRNGDRSAGERLFERHFASVRRFFRNKLSADEGEDLMQRTFLACAQSQAQFRGESSFRTYLFTIARNELYGHLRRRAIRGVQPDLSVRSLVDLQTGPATAAARQQQHGRLLDALRRLPVEMQTLLELAYWEDLSAAELAAVFEVSPVTIRTRKLRARQRLRELLAGSTAADRPTDDATLEAALRAASRR